MLQNFLTMLLNLFQKLPEKLPKKVVKVSEKLNPANTKVNMTIDWKDPKAKISKYFTVREACWLPSWSVLHFPSEVEQKNILLLAEKMDKVRELIGRPIKVTVWIRPLLNSPAYTNHGKDYNAFIKGAKNSAHKDGRAVDWICPGKSCDEIRKVLVHKLVEFDLRMEDLPGSNWVHNDSAPVINNRFFKP